MLELQKILKKSNFVPPWFEVIPHTFYPIFTLFFTLLYSTSCQIIEVPTYNGGEPSAQEVH
jgi:hypothetical protein